MRPNLSVLDGDYRWVGRATAYLQAMISEVKWISRVHDDELVVPFDPAVSSLLVLSTELHPPLFGVLPTL